MSAPKRINTTANSPSGTVTSGQDAKDECESFLAQQKTWIRAVLRGENGSPDIGPGLAEPGGIEALNKAMDEYEELLKRCPKHRREYRKQRVKASMQSEQYTLQQVFGPDKPGRTPSREFQDLGRRAAELYNQVHSWGEVALRLCLRKSLPEHKCDKNCADRIRQIAKPYLK
jgi:hypothetical protein